MKGEIIGEKVRIMIYRAQGRLRIVVAEMTE